MSNATVGVILGDPTVTSTAVYHGQCNYRGTKIDSVGTPFADSVGFYGAPSPFVARQAQGSVSASGVGDKAFWFDGTNGQGNLYAYQGSYAVIVSVDGLGTPSTALDAAKSTAVKALAWAVKVHPSIPPAPTSPSPYPGSALSLSNRADVQPYVMSVPAPTSPSGPTPVQTGLLGLTVLAASGAVAAKTGLISKVSTLLR